MDNNKKMLKCWEIINCKKNKGSEGVNETNECPASKKNMGYSCWAVAGIYHKEQPFCPSSKENRMACLSCPVYKKYNRTTGTDRNKFKEEYPEEEEKYQTIIGKIKIL